MKSRAFFLSAFTALALNATLAMADDIKTQHVVVTGIGDSPQSAAQNAAENALTQVVGSFVDTETILKKKTEIQNGVKDQTKQIDTNTREYSQGSIKHFEVVSTEQDGALIKVTADVEVRIEDFRAYIKKVAEDTTNVDTGLFAKIATSKKQSDNATEMIFDGLTSIVTGEVIQFKIGAIIPFSDWKNNQENPNNLNINHPVSQNTFVLPLEIVVDNAFLEDYKSKLNNISFDKKTIEEPSIRTSSPPCYDARRATAGFDENTDSAIATDNGDSTWSIFMIKNGSANRNPEVDRGDYPFLLERKSIGDAIRDTSLVAPQLFLDGAKKILPDLVVEFSDEGGSVIKKAIVSRNNGYSNSDQTVFASRGWSSIGGDDYSQSSTHNYCLVIYPKYSISLFATLTESELATVKSVKVSMASKQ